MSGKTNDLKSDGASKADDARDAGTATHGGARQNAANKAVGHRDRSGEARAKADDALAGARGMFNKFKQRVSGGK